MPNSQNITRPVTLISNGRSGSSLTMSIFDNHPDFAVCGETVQMLFSTWYGLEKAKGIVAPDRELGYGVDHDLRCAKAVRAVFQTTFPDDRPHWMMKPIGVPHAMNLGGPRAPLRPERYVWYWNALNTSFPEARNITILRHPYDVVLSAVEYWNAGFEQAWTSVVRMARIIDHPESTVDFAIVHQRMVTDPRPEIARLLDHLGLEHHDACFAAADKVYVPRHQANHVPKDKEPELVARQFSRREAWSQIDMSTFTDADREILVKMWARFGEKLEF